MSSLTPPSFGSARHNRITFEFDRPRHRRYSRYALVASRHLQHVLGNVVERHLLAHGRQSHEAGLTPVPLDVIFRGVAEAAVSLDGAVGGEETGLRGKVFRNVGLLTARQIRVVSGGGDLRQLR